MTKKELEEKLENGLDYVRDNGSFIKQSIFSVCGKDIIMYDKAFENEYKYELESWCITLPVDETTDIKTLLASFRELAKQKDCEVSDKSIISNRDAEIYTCHQLCGWTWLKDNENHIITNGKATLVKYAKILKDIN